MVSLRRISDVLDSPRVYELWQTPFAAGKMRPLARHNHLPSIGRVLEVGCGPGTNAAYFDHTHYVGLDFNPKYTEYARRRYGREFITADARTYFPPPDVRYDCVLLNSFLHHIDDENTLGHFIPSDGALGLCRFGAVSGVWLNRLLSRARYRAMVAQRI